MPCRYNPPHGPRRFERSARTVTTTAFPGISMLALPLATLPRDGAAYRGAWDDSSSQPRGYSPRRGLRRFEPELARRAPATERRSPTRFFANAAARPSRRADFFCRKLSTSEGARSRAERPMARQRRPVERSCGRSHTGGSSFARAAAAPANRKPSGMGRRLSIPCMSIARYSRGTAAIIMGSGELPLGKKG
jgi:hypothetical protein